MDSNEHKPAGIKDIAAALGVSIGTVDRALHNRAGVNPGTHARVHKMAEKLGYRPNLAARQLKLNRQLRIAVHMPREISFFFRPLLDGIRSAAASFGPGLQLEVATYPRLNHGDVALLRSAMRQKFDGFLITPGDPSTVQPLIAEIAAKGTPVVCVASDAPRSARLASFTVDAYTSGAIAAELLGRALPAGGSVAAITGELSTLDHADKLRGFAAGLATIAPQLSLLPAVESHEDPKQAYSRTVALLARRPRPAGLYVTTANSVTIFKALQEHRLLGKIQVVATDLFPQLVPIMENGHLLATIFQRPQTQARAALQALAQYLLEGVQPPAVTRFAPHIVLRSNLPLFLDHIASLEAQGAVLADES